MPSKQQQADSEILEDQLLNFLVKSIDEEVSLTLANNAETDAEDIYEVLVGATADGTSISTLCNSSEDSSSANTILYHLRTKFDPERLERAANMLLQREIVELLPEQVEVGADLHLRPYYGDEDATRRSIPLLETLRYRVELSLVRASDSDDNNTRRNGETTVRRGESAVTECVAVSPLRIRGDAPPRRASPLVVAVQGVREYGSTGRVDGPTHREGRPREPAT